MLPVIFYENGFSEIMAWLINFVHSLLLGVITQPCPSWAVQWILIGTLNSMWLSKSALDYKAWLWSEQGSHPCPKFTASLANLCRQTGPRLNIKTVLSTYGDFHVKDKTAVRRLIFNMGIAIPGKTVFLIETAPRSHTSDMRASTRFSVSSLRELSLNSYVLSLQKWNIILRQLIVYF